MSPEYRIVRLRNPGFPHRGFFVSASLAGHDHMCIAAPASKTNKALAPLGNGSLGTVSSPHFGWRSHLRWLRQELRNGIGTCATFSGTK